MWEMFLETFKEDPDAQACNYHFYYKIFTKEFNLGFGSPRTDICSFCEERTQRLKFEQDNDEKQKIVCELIVHKQRAKQFYNLMKEPVPNNTACFVFDLMQNQPLPRTALGEAFYVRQIWQYYLGIVRHYGGQSQQNLDNVYFYTWSENESKRGSSEVCSAVFHHLTNFCAENTEIKKIKLFCDGCSAQNKNYTLLAMLSKLCNDRNVNCEIIFPVRGHSYLPVDRTFGRVEKMLRKTELVLLPDEYNSIFSKVGQVHVLGRDWHVSNWKDAAKLHIKSKMDFKISEMKIIRIDSKCVSCQSDYSVVNQTCSHTLLKRGKKWSSLQTVQIPLGNQVKKEKLDDVKQLINKLGVDDGHPAMAFYKNVFSSFIDDNAIASESDDE